MTEPQASQPERTPEETPTEPPPKEEPREESSAERATRELVQSAHRHDGAGVFNLDIHHPRMCLLFLALNILDFIVTRVAINDAGTDEGNRLAKWVLLNYGLLGMAIYKIALTAMVITLAQIVARKQPRTAFMLLLGGCIAVGFVVLVGAWHVIR